VPLLLEPLPVVTDEPEPPGDIVVLPLTLPPPAVTVLELLPEPPLPGGGPAPPRGAVEGGGAGGRL
jgi:hypothetical protein